MKSRSSWFIVISLSLLFSFALYLRLLPHDQIFTPLGVRFSGIDAYYHMRIVDVLAHGFPFPSNFDPYFVYPGGASVSGPMFFDWLLAGIIWLVGLGHPSPDLIDTVGAYYPAVLGALCVIPVFGVGSALFGRWAGLISAAVFVVLPGEFLGRSTLGFTDQHVMEVLLSTTAIWFLILAIRSMRRGEAVLVYPIPVRAGVFGILAGLWGALYFSVWTGALLLTFVTTVYTVAQFSTDYLAHRKLCVPAVVGLGLAVMALIGVLAFFSNTLQTMALAGSAASVAGLFFVSERLEQWKFPRWGLLPAIGAVLLAVVVGVYIVSPLTIASGFFLLRSIFFPVRTMLTTMEAQPILAPGGIFTLSVVWGNFGPAIILALAGLVALIVSAIRNRLADADRTLLIVWSLVILALMLGQRRFAYYFGVNVAVLTGFVCWSVARLALPKRVVGKRKVEGRPVEAAVLALLVLLPVLIINLKPAINTGKQALFAPSDAWVQSLTWLRDNSPEPLSDPKYEPLYDSSLYCQRFSFGSGEKYPYPSSAYGVLSWWDYGYWITRIARRPPTVHPAQNSVEIARVARFLLSQDEESAHRELDGLGVRYIILDNSLSTSKLWAIARWAGMDESRFFGTYYRRQGNQLKPMMLFYPEYYRTMLARLYNFDGGMVTPQVVPVARYEERVSNDGQRYRAIIDTRVFPSEQAAAVFLKQEPQFRSVGPDPMQSLVALPPLLDWRLVHTDGVINVGQSRTAEVKVFECTDWRGGLDK